MKRRTDPVLRALVSITEESQIEMSITLHVSGTAIGGELTTQKQFAQGVAELMDRAKYGIKEPHAAELREKMREYFRGQFTGLAELSETIRVEHLEADNMLEWSDEVEFVHLRNAIIVSAHPARTLGWWRCRLESVDAFNIGCWRPEP